METLNKEQLLYSPNSAAHALDISRSYVYELMKFGLMKYVTFGNERRIPAEEIKRMAVEGIPSVPRQGK